jgi:hypothetical protein
VQSVCPESGLNYFPLKSIGSNRNAMARMDKAQEVFAFVKVKGGPSAKTLRINANCAGLQICQRVAGMQEGTHERVD